MLDETLLEHASAGDAIFEKVSLQDVLQKCNENLMPYGLAIRTSRNEADGKLYYVFVNTVSITPQHVVGALERSLVFCTVSKPAPITSLTRRCSGRG